MIYFAADWIESWHRYMLDRNVVVSKAGVACELDGMSGCEFSSVARAQKYLDCGEKWVKRRDAIVAERLKKELGSCKNSPGIDCQGAIKGVAEIDAKLETANEMTICVNDLAKTK